MANPSVRSTSSNATLTNGTSVSCTHPSGLTAGDLMILFLVTWDLSGDTTPTVPSGWTVLQSASFTTADFFITCMTKVADASDVSAGSTSVTVANGYDQVAWGMYAITGVASSTPISVSEKDTFTASGTTLTATTALTPVVAESLVISAFAVIDFNLSAALSASSFSLTPTTTMTEDIDVGLADGSSDGISLHVASGSYDGTTEITSRSVTISESVTNDIAAICIVVNAPQAASSTNDFFAVSPVVFDNAGGAGVATSNDFFSVTPTLNSPSVELTKTIVPTNVSKPTVESPTNIDKP